jgi:EAL domain-containing protein (putative c-di-GMP-specific phosphodiesterase class I)/CheY-like chemotaxis protein
MVISFLRILVIEAQSFQRTISVAALNRLGSHRIFEAASESEALALLLREGAVDIVICDMGIDSLTFVRALGVHSLAGAIILASALPDDLRHTARQIMSASGLKYLGSVGKPLQGELLEQLIERYSLVTPTGSQVSASIGLVDDEEVLRAFKEKKFCAYFQPKVNLRTGEVNGVEVLARWNHPSLGLLTPAVFLYVLERHGLMGELLFEQLEQGLSLRRAIRAKGYDFSVALNIQPEQLSDPTMVPRIEAALKRHGVSATDLIFEVTECSAWHASVESIETLFQLRLMGCGLSIDDFGTGYSSLHRLSRLPFTEIKIDASFVREINQDARFVAIISSILTLGKALDISVVAEGIETEEQNRFLFELGCKVGQGYLLGRPMSTFALLRWLDDGRKIATETKGYFLSA